MAEASTTRIEAAHGYGETDRGPTRGNAKEKSRPKAAAREAREDFGAEDASDAEETEKHALDTIA